MTDIFVKQVFFLFSCVTFFPPQVRKQTPCETGSVKCCLLYINNLLTSAHSNSLCIAAARTVPAPSCDSVRSSWEVGSRMGPHTGRPLVCKSFARLFFVIFSPSGAKEENTVLKSGDLTAFAQSLLPIHWQLHNKWHLLGTGLGSIAIVSHC